jgi:preprotein translocase subunit SecD
LIATGALPLTLQNIDQNTVSATLGSDSLRAGLIAGILGLAATFVYVLLFYRGLGLVIWGGLAIAAALNVGIVLLMGKLIGFTLTLAGIAGLIVAIGISADSYVVFFERLKDEVREGRTLRTSVDRGWARSFHTLVSANTVSFAAAVVLYIFAIGPVRGFAFTLGLATLIDFFAAWCYGRPAVSLLTRTRLFQEGRFVGIRAAV